MVKQPGLMDNIFKRNIELVNVMHSMFLPT